MPSTRVDVAHLMRRAGFGGTTAQIDAMTSLDRAGLVAAVLATRQLEPSPPAELTADLDEWQKIAALQGWWFDRMTSSSFTDTSKPCPIVERMAMFWHNHFATSGDKSYNAQALYEQNALFRKKGLGNFRELCHEMSVQVAMLVYLDNESNTAGSPNQNFARELMELFMLGVGNYTEDDVANSAAAWSGHGLDYDENWQNPVYAFHPDDHDTVSRTILGKTQVWDGPQVIDWILDNPSTAPIVSHFIARKVWTWLAYPKPADEIVNAMATAFQTEWNIASMLQAMFLRDEFWSTTAKNGLLRTPIEFAVAAAKAIGLNSSQLHPEWTLDGMGMELFYPPNVSGWKVNDYWISTSAMAARASFAGIATWVTLGGDGVNPSFLCDVTGEAAEGQDWVPYADRVPTNQVIPNVLERFGIIGPSAQTVTQLTNWHTKYRTPGVDEWPWGERAHLVQLVLLSPDFQMA